MNKYLIIIALAGILLSSCERTDCEFRKEGYSYSYEPKLSESRDAFHTDVLYGMWQMQNGLVINGHEIEELWFTKDGRVELVLEDGHDPIAYTVTGTWRRYGKSIDIATDNLRFSLWIEKYTWPSLYVQCGSPQTFEMIKRRTDNY